MAYYTIADLTALQARLPAKIKDVIFSGYVGYFSHKREDGFWYLNSPFGDEPKDIRERGPFETKEQSWNACPDWSSSGSLIIHQMTRICRPETIRARGDIGEIIKSPVYDDRGTLVDAIYEPRIRFKWWLHGVCYVGDSFDYADAALNCYIEYMISQVKSTGSLPDLDERGI